VGGVSTAIAVTSSSDIWNYQSRSLTRVFGIIERALGYGVGATQLYRAYRVVENTTFKLITNASFYFIGDERNDILSSATRTVLQTGFNDELLRDHDDSTYTQPANDIPANYTVDLVRYDFGTINNRFIKVKMESTNTNAIVRLLVSSDGVSYNTVAYISNNIIDSVYFTSFRYIKLQAYNSSTSAMPASNYKYYTLEVYEPSNTSTLTYASRKIILMQAYISGGYYQLLEIVNI